MKTLNISMSDADFRHYGFPAGNVRLKDFLRIIRQRNEAAKAGDEDFDVFDPKFDAAFAQLPGAEGAAERLAAADAYWKSGGKGLSVDEFFKPLEDTLKSGIEHGTRA
jgi:hypothetical protein